MSRLIALLLLAAVLPAANAQTAMPESPLAYRANDPQLKWGPCPPFIPKGCEIAVLHGDPAKNNVDIFFKVPGKSEVPAHWHTSVERMILVSGNLHVTYDGQPTTVLKTGMYAYGPAKAPHKAKCVSKEACILFIAFESPLDAVPVEVTAAQK